MWIKEVIEVIKTGSTRGYEIAPTAFWLVRVFDLGFSIPLGLLSVYLLWTRAARAYPLIYMVYGFFFTQILAVNAMGWMMFVKQDPAFIMRDLIVFTGLALVNNLRFHIRQKELPSANQINCPLIIEFLR